MTGRLRVREIDDDEGQRLVRVIRRGSGSVVTWRRAQMVLLSAQGMDVASVAKVAFTSEDRVRDVIRNFNADGFSSLYPKYKGGHPPKFTLPQRREIKKIAKSKPAERGKEPGRAPRPRMRATYTRTAGGGTCSLRSSWARTSCSGMSSRARPGPGSWNSAATCAPSTRPLPGSRSSATTTART